MAKLILPDVTLCAVASVNVAATVEALKTCAAKAEFGRVMLLSDESPANIDDRIEVTKIGRLGSAKAYSQFMLRELAPHIGTSHCLVVQWDGFILDPEQWQPEFLQYDYIGAPWPQFLDGQDVGNGGFSLRSRRLLDLCREPAFEASHPEDIAICRLNRRLVEDRGLRIAERAIAERFAYERTAPKPAFGVHGVFNLLPVLGVEEFWSLYRSLDDRTSAIADWTLLIRQLSRSKKSLGRQLRIAVDAILAALRR